MKQLYYDALTGPVAVKLIARCGKNKHVIEVTEGNHVFRKGGRFATRNYRLINLIGDRQNQHCITADLSEYGTVPDGHDLCSGSV